MRQDTSICPVYMCAKYPSEIQARVVKAALKIFIAVLLTRKKQAHGKPTLSEAIKHPLTELTVHNNVISTTRIGECASFTSVFSLSDGITGNLTENDRNTAF